MEQISVIGAGTWGIALANILVQQHSVIVYSVLKDEIDHLKETYVHPNLHGVVLSKNIVFTDNLEEALHDRKYIIIAVPSVFVRDTMKLLYQYINSSQRLIIVSKGIEKASLSTLSEVVESECRDKKPAIIAFSGPSHAEEVAQNMPTTIVAASEDIKAAKEVQELFTNSCIRVYTNTDVKGTELCGAIKNVIALACGIANGLGYGDNTKAAIITRGIAEIKRLGTALGANESTFLGLAGIGDLVVTATSKHSRNNKCGYLIGQGYTLEEAKKEVGMVVEGLSAIEPALNLAKKYNVEMPITEMVNEIVFHNIPAKKAVDLLMNRDLKSENEPLQ